MSVCAVSGRSIEYCIYVQNSNSHYRLPPGGQVTVHFHQLVVANAIRIRKAGFLTLCEVDVFGTKVVLAPEGQFTGLLVDFTFFTI